MERARASSEQFATLLEFMESNGDLAKPQPGAQGRLRAENLWQELTSALNSIGGGANRTSDKWKKVWADWKSKTRKKALAIRRHVSGTGGGPSNRVTLSSMEESVLGIIGILAVEGHPDIEDQGLDRGPATSQSRGIENIEMVVEVELAESVRLQPPTSEQLPTPGPSSQRRRSPSLPAVLQCDSLTHNSPRESGRVNRTHVDTPPRFDSNRHSGTQRMPR